MRKVFIITGATGFLGSHIVKLLSKDKNNIVRALVMRNDRFESILDKYDCEKFYGDVRDKTSLEKLFNVDEDEQLCVIHCAAIVYIGSKYDQKVFDVNVTGTKNIAELALKYKAKMVYVSSVHALTEKKDNEIIRETTRFEPDKVVGIYARSKAIAGNIILDMVAEENLDCCIVHPSGIIGPSDPGNSHMTQLMIDYYQGKLMVAVKGGYDFVDVRDVVQGIIEACYKGKSGECYILSNRYITVKELLDLISEVSGKEKIKIYLPIFVAKIAAPFVEFYCKLRKQRPLYTKYSIYTLGSNANFCNTKARNELGFKTRELKETIKDTIDQLRADDRL